jgi:hypothetical protein
MVRANLTLAERARMRPLCAVTERIESVLAGERHLRRYAAIALTGVRSFVRVCFAELRSGR